MWEILPFPLWKKCSSSTTLSLYVCSVDVWGSDARLNSKKEKKGKNTFIYSLLCTHYCPPRSMVKHTPMLKCHLQVVLAKMSDKIRNDERQNAQTKEKFPWRCGSFLGSVRRKMMKHLSRRNVRPNQRSCGQQRNAEIIKSTSDTTSPQICITTKYSHTTWLISITSLPDILPVNCLWQVCQVSALADFGKICCDTPTPHRVT